MVVYLNLNFLDYLIFCICILLCYDNDRYGGEQAGTAVADVIFGNYNPAGRLPITFYSSTDQIPPFENYDMKSFIYIIFQFIFFFFFQYCTLLNLF
jgi:hypothetical protein